MHYLGIDPGKSGGLALVTDSPNGEGACAIAMPKTDRDIWNWFEEVLQLPCVVASLEKVASRPGQGVRSMFTFGENYGLLRGLLTASGIRFSLVTPRTWQKELGIAPRNKQKETPTQFKTRLKEEAQRLFPKLKITKATADALLIAEYTRRTTIKKGSS